MTRSPSARALRRRTLRTLAVAGLSAGGLLGLAGLPDVARAHGPTPQKAQERIAIAAPPDRVWALVSAFGDIAKWNPAAKSSSADKGAQVGSVRTIERVAGGGRWTEELDEIDPARMVLGYRSGREIDPAVFPASSYSARMEVAAEGQGSVVTWSARGYRADTTNEPPEGRDDEAVRNALTEWMKSGLDGLKKQAEAAH